MLYPLSPISRIIEIYTIITHNYNTKSRSKKFGLRTLVDRLKGVVESPVSAELGICETSSVGLFLLDTSFGNSVTVVDDGALSAREERESFSSLAEGEACTPIFEPAVEGSLGLLSWQSLTSSVVGSSIINDRCPDGIA